MTTDDIQRTDALLREEGLDLRRSFQGLQEMFQAKGLLKAAACTSEAMRDLADSDTPRRAETLLEQVGSSSVDKAATAVRSFLALGEQSNAVIRAIGSKLRQPLGEEAKRILLERLGDQCRVLAFCHGREDLPVPDALKHLHEDESTFYTLVEGRGRSIHVVVGASDDDRFEATWLQFPRDASVFLIRRTRE